MANVITLSKRFWIKTHQDMKSQFDLCAEYDLVLDKGNRKKLLGELQASVELKMTLSKPPNSSKNGSGMSIKFKHIALGGRRDQVFLGEEIAQRRECSERTAREVDEEIKSILEEAFNRAKSTIEENLDGLNNVVDALFEREEIPGSEVQNLIGSNDK